MDAKYLRTESTLSERKDGSKYTQSGAAQQQYNRNKTYQDIGTNPLGKAETAAGVRPCAVIGPDRVLPPPNANDAYLKKGSIEPWPCPDNIYSQLPDYHHKMSNNPNQMRNISPRQTFQENMPRIMVPPAYNSIKNTTDGSNFNHVQDRAPVLSKNPKPNMALEAKYCDVPYTVNQLSNEHKSFRESEISVPSVNSPLMRTIPHEWSPNSGNLHAPRTYGAHEVYQFQQYPNSVGPRPPMLPVGRRHQTFQDEAGYVYPDSYYQDPSLRFKTYPQVKERYPQPRIEYIGNYPNPYHPPPTFPPHKYDIPKPGTAHQYPVYSHLKYLENRASDPTIRDYQRSPNQPPPGYNMPFRNQVIHPTYPGVANAQAKLPYSVDSTGKPMVTNKLPYDSNKLYIDYDNARNKSYAVNDPYFLNDINRVQPPKNQIMPPNYPTANMHHFPTQQFLRKDIHMKPHEYMPHFRNFDPSVGSYTMIRHPSHFSPNTIAISPTDSNTSNDTTQTQGTNQEDCGYISQSSSASVRSVESGVNRMSGEYYKRHDYRYGPIGNTHMQPKHEVKGKKQIDVRQFLQMWNEGDDENGENNNKDSIAQTSTSNVNQDNKQEQLYVLGLVNVPNEELSKYEHIQTVSKLPEHIKGYNSIELLKQYEEVVESSNLNSFKSPVSKNFQMPLRDNRNTPKQVVEVLPRPISPLDVEAKISQSVIHKEVGCNFEIKPCSPKMLNVEIPAPIQNVLGERVIEKVSNPLSKVTDSPISVHTDDDSLHNNLKRQISHSSYEKSSCKILGSPFTPHNLDSVKTDYSIQDLEINSGVCLASLPRLDNEIELNFPEVNQQFIDANKIDNNTSKDKSTPKESNTVVERKSPTENVAGSEDIQEQNIAFSQDDSQKEYTRLNTYRKTNSTEYSENTMTAVRTDSVIIKNPETLKNVGNSPRNDHSNLISEETHVPVNLTSHIDVNNRTIKTTDLKSNQDKTETYAAIDFSLNKNDRANKVSKKSKTRSSKQIVNETHKLKTKNCFEVPLNDAKAHHKDNHFQETNDESDIQVTEIYKKESNSYLPNINSEEIDNLNEYSCKADFDDVMKKLTANDFEMTSEINLESNNIITNSNDCIGNVPRFDSDKQELKSKCDIHPNENFVTLQQSTNHDIYKAESLIEKEKCNQQSMNNKKKDLAALKVEAQTEPKQHQEDNKNSDKENLTEEYYSDLSVHKSTKFQKSDTDKLIQEEQGVKAKQLNEIENISVNNLSEKDKTVSIECKKSNVEMLSEENQNLMLKSQQIESVNFDTDQLIEEKESVKIKQQMEVENVNKNSLHEKDETKECNIFHLDILIKEERFTTPKQMEREHFNKEERKPKKMKNFDSNILTADDQSISLELQIKESKTLNSNTLFDTTSKHNIQRIMTFDAETLSKGDQNVLPKQGIRDFATETIAKEEQNTITEKPSQKNINLDSEKLAEGGQPKNPQQKFATPTTLEKIEMNVPNKKDHSLTLANPSLENETCKDLLFENEHVTMQEQHSNKADAITESSNKDTKILAELQSIEIKAQCEDNISIKTSKALAEEEKSISQSERPQLSAKDNSFDAKMLFEQQNVDTEIQQDDNQSVETGAITKADQSMSHNEKPSTENVNFGTEVVVNPLNVETKTQHEHSKCVKTDAITEDGQSMPQNERPQLSTKNNCFDSEMLVEQQSVDTKIQQEDNKSVKTGAITEEDQSMSQNERPQLSTENINFGTEMEVDPLNVETIIQHGDNKCVKIDATTEENQTMSLNKGPQFSTENNSCNAEMLVEQQNLVKNIQQEDNKSVKTGAMTAEDQSMSQNGKPQLSKENINFATEMVVDQLNVETIIQHEENICVETDSTTEENQSMSQNKGPQLPTENINFDTEMLIEQQNIDTKIQHIKCEKTDAITEGDQRLSHSERPQLATENTRFDTEIRIYQQNVEKKTQHKSNKNEAASTEQDQSKSQKLQSEDNSSIDSVMPVEEQNLDSWHAIENKQCLEDCISDNNLELENIPLPASSPIDCNDSKEPLQNYKDCTSDNNLELENIPLPASSPIDCNDSKEPLQNYNDCISDNNLKLENIPLPASSPINSNDSNEPLQNCISKHDEKFKHDMYCNFKPINNNSHYKIKLYSPQIQKLMLHVEGLTNYDNDTFIEKVETTNKVTERESRIGELPNISDFSLELKTGTEETLIIQYKDTELLPPVTIKPCDKTDRKPIIKSVIKEPNKLCSKSFKGGSQLEPVEKCDSTKPVISELDPNTNYSTDEEVTSSIAVKNLKTSYGNGQNDMINDFTVNTKFKEINANELSLSDCDNISATSECVNIISQKSDGIDSENPDGKNTDLDETNMSNLKFMGKIQSEFSDIDRTMHHNITDVTSETNYTTFATHDKNFGTPEMYEENVVCSRDKNIQDSDQSNDYLKIRHTSLKRSLSDSALNTFAQDNKRELSWPTKRRKIEENTLEQNIINESICRLIQASRRNSISSFDNEENVSFCILIDDTCILAEENAQDKICYTEVTESTESDTMDQIEDNVVTGSMFSQNDIDLLTTDAVIYECQEDVAVDEEPWVEDIACIETVSCENVVEELVMSSSTSPKHGYNDTVISENVAEDIVITSPSSIKGFEDDFVNVAPTFNHDWVETLVDDGVAEDVVISSFLTVKEECLVGEIRTNLEETIANSPSNLKGEWNEDMSVSSVLTNRQCWDEKLFDVKAANDAVADSRLSTKWDCIEARVNKEENVLITSSPKKCPIEFIVKKNDTSNTMDSSLTPKHSHSYKRVVKVTDVMITDSPSSSKDHLEYDDNELSCYNLHEHANKVKSIYGERMTDGDAQIVDTLFRTPQMDVNKTLLHDPLELDISAKLSHMEYSDDSSSESSHQKSSLCIFPEYSDCKYNESDIANRNTYQNENIVAEKLTSQSACNESIDTDNSIASKCIPQDKTVQSCESSTDNVFAYDDSNYTSSSPEVSSTTSEEKNSSILLKITNLNGSRISQINEIKSDRKPRCKFTEKKDYSSNRFPNRPLITKAAQKYIPPVKESIRDLKVKISLPPQSLLKFKELKLSRNVTKVTNKQSSSNIPKIPKKPKPLFEDVLKSIDEIQIKMHREKKKPKTTVPKVVIKKNEYGSHYASTPTKEIFNPDLTGRKWQPWVFIERNNFIDKMALKNKTRAVFNHRKKCYVLAEKFKKYKSAVSNTKFVISRPSSIKSMGQLKYTIKLKHSY